MTRWWRGLVGRDDSTQYAGQDVPDIIFEVATTILICTPICLPIAARLGMDPVQFGIMMPTNCALGLNTPPSA